MRFNRRLLILLIAPAIMHAFASAQEFGDITFSCPPCGCPGDAITEPSAGSCSVCGMPMVERPPFRNIAFLIYDHMQLADLAGAFSVFEGARMFTVYTVGQRSKPVKTHPGGVTITPHFTFEDCPKPDILVIPGGGVARQVGDTAVISWIRRTSADAKLVLSVCTGVFILAKTGLIDGLSATVLDGDLEQLRKAAPRVQVVSERRFVDNGKFLSAAGPFSGVDASLHVLRRIFGNDARAKEVAAYIDYRWVEE